MNFFVQTRTWYIFGGPVITWILFYCPELKSLNGGHNSNSNFFQMKNITASF